jgi:hypothetical protein
MSGSSISDIIRSAHSFCMMFGNLRYSRRSVSAAFFLTNAFEALLQLATGFAFRVSETNGDISSLCTSPQSASPISFPPTLAIACSAKQLFSSLWSSRSFLMLLTTRCSSSCSSCRNRVTARYPICFSEYLVAEIRLTASR